MKFSVDRHGHIEQLTFRLNSCHVNLTHQYKPLDTIEYRYPTTNPNTGYILFDDSYEIDRLIDALQEFKNISQNYMGSWRPKP